MIFQLNKGFVIYFVRMKTMKTGTHETSQVTHWPTLGYSGGMENQIMKKRFYKIESLACRIKGWSTLFWTLTGTCTLGHITNKYMHENVNDNLRQAKRRRTCTC